MLHLPFWLCLFIFFIYSNIYCQDTPIEKPADKKPKTELPSETIKSNQETLNIQTESVTIIDQKTIKNSIGGFSEILKKVNSVRINELGGIGQFATALIRGSNSKQIKIYKDGIPLSNNRDGQTNLSTINTKNISAIEIYKGYHPAYLASNSAGAVINIITNQKEQKSSSQIKIDSTYGSFDTLIFHTLIEEKNKKNFISVNLDHIQSNNNFNFHNDKGTPYNQDDDFIDQKNHNAYKNHGLDFTIGTYTDYGQWAYHVASKIGEQEIGGPKNTVINSAVNKFSEISSNITHKIKIKDNLKLESILYASLNSKIINDPLGEIGFSVDKRNEKNLTAGLKNLLNITYNQNHFSNILLEPITDKFIKSDKLSNQKSTWQRDTIDFCFEQGYAASSKKFDMKINCYVEYINDISNIYNKAESSENDLNTTFKASAQYTTDSEYQFKFSSGQDLRVPSLLEKYGDSGLIIGNSSLENEKYFYIELSAQKKWEFTNNLKSIESIITAYSKKGEDIISYQQLSAGIARPFNIDKTMTYGLEYQLNFNHQYFELINQFDLTEAENNSDESYLNGKKIPGIPLYRFFSELNINLKNWVLFYRCNFSGKEYFDEANLLPEERKIIQDAGIKYVYKKFDFKLEIKNLSDIQREDFVNYPLPGRSYWFQINITF